MPGLPLWPLLIGLLVAGPALPIGSTDPELAAGAVRGVSAELRWVIDDLGLRSPTARGLIARLGCTDAIVYVERTASPLIPTARTKLVTTVPGARFIRIGIHTSISRVALGPLLAHELQHAVEIAERGEVRDENAVRDLYLKIGRARGGDRFETDAAQQVEWAVREELHIKMAE